MSELKRTLSLKDAISVVAGSMIGSGIFIVSSHIARDVDSSMLLIFVWMLAGFITMLGALSYGELSSTIPSEGGQYIYLKKIFSKKLAFIYGWTLFLVIQTGTLAAVNIAMAKFVGLICPFISQGHKVLEIGSYCLTTQQVFAIFSVLFLTFINSRGIKTGVLVQNIFTVTKVLSIILIIICGLFFGFNFETLFSNFSSFIKFYHRKSGLSTIFYHFFHLITPNFFYCDLTAAHGGGFHKSLPLTRKQGPDVIPMLKPIIIRKTMADIVRSTASCHMVEQHIK